LDSPLQHFIVYQAGSQGERPGKLIQQKLVSQLMLTKAAADHSDKDMGRKVTFTNGKVSNIE
jgi:hypothetical protein